MRDLNSTYLDTPALYGLDRSPEGFAWIDADDAARNVFSFVRRAPGADDLVCVANFAAIPHDGFRLGLPGPGTWVEVVNTDAEAYTGSGVGNLGSVEAVPGDWSGQPAHADLVIPPLATIWLRKA